MPKEKKTKKKPAPKKSTAVKKKATKVKVISKNRLGIGGAPIKLTDGLVDKLCDLIVDWEPLMTDVNVTERVDVSHDLIKYAAINKTVLEFQRLSTYDCVAFELGISKSTLYNYARNDNGVYDNNLSNEFLHALKIWETKRNYYNQLMLPFFPDNVTPWIFQTKNFLGIQDINYNEFNIHSGGKSNGHKNPLENISSKEAIDVVNSINKELKLRGTRANKDGISSGIIQGRKRKGRKA